MATVPDASVGKPSRISDERLWTSAAVIGLGLWLAYTLIPSAYVTTRNGIIYPLVEFGAVVGIVVGVRRYRPGTPWAWLLIAGGVASWLVGDIVWVAYELAGAVPYPSLADVFYLAGYLWVTAGLILAVVRRGRSLNLRALLDAATIAVAAGFMAWIYLVQPTLADSSITTAEKVVTVAYPVADLLLLAVAARFVMGARWRVVALRLLVAGLALTLVGDTLYALGAQISRLAEDTRIADSMLLFGVVALGLAGLHRSMPALTEPEATRDVTGGTPRLILLGAVCLAPITTLVVQSVRGAPLYLPATLLTTVVLVALVTLRFSDMTKRARSAAHREAVLSRYAADLLRANDQDTLLALASSTAGDLLPEGRVAVVAPPRGDVAGHTYAVPVEVRGAVVAELLADAKPSGIRRVHDAFDTVAAQLALAIERRQLRETERESARALAEQNERLLELDRMKDQFVSTVSHELRTPLTSMIGYLELLREGEAGDLTEEQAHFVEIVDRNSHRLNDLIDDILFLSRVDGGRFSLNKKPVDLASLVREQVESIGGAAATKGVELRLTIEEDPPPINADASRLVQLIDNLLSNAVKFTPDGGIIRVTVGTRGGAAHLEVSDSGVGIPKDEVDRLFQRFFRASTAGTIKGTGLGLSIAKAIVDAHGGTISLQSEVGVGTTFMVDLPVGAAPEPEAAASTPTEVTA